MEKREMLKHKQLMIWAKNGYWVTQSSLDEVFMSDDALVLEQIESLRELREKYPKLAKDINSDLFELQTNPNGIRIKAYNEQYATGMRNDIEEEMVEILYYLSIFENAQLTDKQRQLLLDIVSGFSYEGRHKDFGFMCKKLEKAKEKVNKMSENKRQFTPEQLRSLFPNYYSKPNTYLDEYLNISRKPEIYKKSVAESKRTGDYYRQLSLKYSIFPYPFDENNYESLD